MGNRTAKFISALVGSIVAGAPLAAVSQNAPAPSSTASTAADCLASPKGTAPQGQHWFYRLDRATKRQCWYLRAEGGKATQSAQATTDTQNVDPTASPSVQNARAEYIAPQTAAAPAAASAPPAAQQPSPPADNTAQQPEPAVAARWPDAAATAAAPAPVALPIAKPTKPAAPVALAAAEIPADKPTGSLQMLLLVIGGALALAGLLASIIYRFAGGRVRIQASDHRRVNWDDFEPHDLDDNRAPWLSETPAAAQQPRPVDFDAARPQPTRPQAPQLAAFTNEIGRIAAQSRSTHHEAAADLDEADIFNEEFEIEAAPRLVANETDNAAVEVDEEPAAHDEDAVDIDVITAMLERLAQEGPRLSQPDLSPGPGAVLVDLARSPRGQSAARA